MTEPKVIYIVAHGHSGTTLLDTLLGNLEGAVSSGEVDRIAKWATSDDPAEICTCGADINDCELWGPCCDWLKQSEGQGDLDRRAFWRRYPLHLGDYSKRLYVGLLLPALLMIGWTPLLRLFRRHPVVADALRTTEHSWRLFDALGATQNSRVVVDSSKSPLRMKLLYMTRGKRPFYVIHVVRDGRAIAASYQRRDPRGVGYYAHEWRRRFAYRAAMLLSVSRRHKRVLRYEDLATDARGQLASLCRFIGEPEERVGPALALSEQGGVVKHNVGGNPARLTQGAFDKVRLDERWRRELTDQDLAAFQRRAGWLNRLLGYK